MNKGYFVVPTIFTNATQKMKIAREEIFGPVAVIMEKFTSDDKVLRWPTTAPSGFVPISGQKTWQEG